MTDKEKLEKIKVLADKMHDTAFNITTDASLLRKAMYDYHQFTIYEYHKKEPVSEDTMTIRKEWFEHCKESWYNEGYIDGKYNRDRQFEEPVSEDLEEAAKRYATEGDEISGLQIIEVEKDAFIAGAEWQKQQILDCNTTLQRTFELGKQEMKQQMMANAIDVTVYIDAGGYPYIPQIELYDYDKDIPLAKERDKYKVVLIKED